MRDFKGMKRQRGRNRSGGGGGGGGGKPNNNVNRAFDSNGPDNVKIRGHAQHVYEKYQQLARDAASSGDRVLAENYLQHAEHYFRVLRTLQPQRPPSEIVGRDVFSSGFDIDFDDEGTGEAPAAEEGEAAAEGQGQGEAGESRRDDRQERGEWRRDDRPDRGERQEFRRDDRQRDDRPRDDRQRDDRPRDERQRDERRDDRPRDRYRDSRGPRPEGSRYGEDNRSEPREPQAQAEPEMATANDDGGSVLRSQDGGVSQAPAFLQAAAPAPGGEDGEPRRTRRRSRSRTRGEGEAGPAGEGGEE